MGSLNLWNNKIPFISTLGNWKIPRILLNIQDYLTRYKHVLKPLFDKVKLGEGNLNDSQYMINNRFWKIMSKCSYLKGISISNKVYVLAGQNDVITSYSGLKDYSKYNNIKLIKIENGSHLAILDNKDAILKLKHICK